MPSTCPNCGAEIGSPNGERPNFCIYCGFRLVTEDGLSAEPQGSGNPLYDRVRSSVVAATMIDYRTEPYDRESTIDAFNRMSKLEHLRTNEPEIPDLILRDVVPRIGISG